VHSFVRLMRCQSLFSCVCKHLFCYIYVLRMHVQMNPTSALVYQSPPFVKTLGFPTPHAPTPPLVWLGNNGEALLSSTSNADLCDLCKARENPQPQMYPVMSLPVMAPPGSQSVDQGPGFPKTAPMQCVPVAPNSYATTQVHDSVFYVFSNHAQGNTPSMAQFQMSPCHTSGSGLFGGLFGSRPRIHTDFFGREVMEVRLPKRNN